MKVTLTVQDSISTKWKGVRTYLDTLLTVQITNFGGWTWLYSGMLGYWVSYHSDDEGSKHLWNASLQLSDYTAYHPRRQPSSLVTAGIWSLANWTYYLMRVRLDLYIMTRNTSVWKQTLSKVTLLGTNTEIFRLKNRKLRNKELQWLISVI
jgi:hypothetical protein